MEILFSSELRWARLGKSIIIFLETFSTKERKENAQLAQGCRISDHFQRPRHQDRAPVSLRWTFEVKKKQLRIDVRPILVSLSRRWAFLYHLFLWKGWPRRSSSAAAINLTTPKKRKNLYNLSSYLSLSLKRTCKEIKQTRSKKIACNIFLN